MKMSTERAHQISIRMDRKLSDLSNTSNEHCIFKVHDELRRHNEEAFEPRVISIGPYHHGKPDLEKMEKSKLRYLQELLIRRQEESTERYFIALIELEDHARRCYAEEINLSKDDFLEMTCLDGLFVIEFLRKLHMPYLRNSDDTIFQTGWLFSHILRDLILFENQVPFEILVKLFDLSKFPDSKENLIDLALSLCCLMEGYGPPKCFDTQIFANRVIHLLDLVHTGWCSSFAAKLSEDVRSKNFSLENIKSASELEQSGIKFERAGEKKEKNFERPTQNESWLDITFENGKIKIPRLTVEDYTETVFRNLLAYEEYMCKDRKCVSDYIMFMDLLMDSPRDVEKLRHQHIIRNWLGDDEAVCKMFNKLGNDISMDDSRFCYIRVFEEVNKYSINCWNIWWANLMMNYFNSPWSIISFLAALVLLILTFVQTMYSVLQYYM